MQKPNAASPSQSASEPIALELFQKLLSMLAQNDAKALADAFERGVSPNAAPESAPSLLSTACGTRELRGSCALALLNAGAWPQGNQTDQRSGRTPLRVALENGAAPLAQALIKAGAPLDLDPGEKSDLLGLCLGDPESVEALIVAGVDVNSMDHLFETPLMRICSFISNLWDQAPKLRSCSLLIEAGADLSLTNKEGRTALDLARLFKAQPAIDLISAALERKALLESTPAPKRPGPLGPRL